MIVQAGNVVLLASEDSDFGLVSAEDARIQAQLLANEEDVVITVRDPITDQVIDTIKPDAEAQCRITCLIETTLAVTAI